jgi:peptide/nickel transport system ATP-binding protein
MTIGDQIVEAIRIHKDIDKSGARAEALDLLRRVGIPAPDERLDAFPHELSGGMKQRAMIAMALSCRPKLLIADEPTTALDVSVQAQILELLNSLKNQFGMGLLLVTHDFGVVAEMADHVVVMKAGQVVETAKVKELFAQPRHDYTRALLDCLGERG